MTEFDLRDFRVLATQVFKQAVDDYVKLQHPTTRTKKYIHESFLAAVDMFWDPTYRMGAFVNEDKEPMSLEEFLLLATDRQNLDLEALYSFLMTESKNYWEDKSLMLIPDIVMVCEVPYDVRHAEQDAYTVDYAQRTIFLNKTSSSKNQINFLIAILEIICFHEDLRMSVSVRNSLGKVLSETLSRNNYFVPAIPTLQDDAS